MDQTALAAAMTGVATRALGADGGRLQAGGLVAPVQDEVAPGKNGRLTPHAAGPRAEHAKGLLGRHDIVATRVVHCMIARDDRKKRH